MSQHDWDVEDGSGAEVRSNLNASIRALATQSFGAADPPTPLPLMPWADSANNILKIRNAGNTAWIEAFAIEEGAVVPLKISVDGVSIQQNAQGQLEVIQNSAAWLTGDVRVTTRVTPAADWLHFDGATIGSAASGADHAGAEYEALFVHLWTVMADTWAPVSSGRGGTAAADFALNKTLTLLNAAGRGIIAAGAGPGLTPRVVGELGGEEVHAQTLSELFPHRHEMGRTPTGSSGSVRADGPANNNSNDALTSPTGGGQPFNVMSPFAVMNLEIKI